jgi:protein-S-isoprenylcysteine O-methyltransferase Ste14
MVNTQSSMFGRVAIFAYGMIAYACFLGVFLYAIGFIGNALVPKSIDTGPVGPIPTAVVVNALLLSLFVIQHTVMARPAFKERWTRIIPKPMERSTFVLATCLVLSLTFWQWRPMPGIIWQVSQPAARVLFHAMFGLGFAIVLYSSFLIDHFDLFGVRQVFQHLRASEPRRKGFVTPTLYRMVRNPLMLGFIIAFWSTPDMTQGHLLFSALTTGYIFFGVSMEERDLLNTLGEDYRRYREKTPMLLPWPRRGKRPHRDSSPSRPAGHITRPAR